MLKNLFTLFVLSVKNKSLFKHSDRFTTRIENHRFQQFPADDWIPTSIDGYFSDRNTPR